MLIDNFNKNIENSNWSGIELSEYRVENSKYKNDNNLIIGDLLDLDYSDYNFIYLSNVCFTDELNSKIEYKILNEEPIFLNHNSSLIEWVIENICKNGVDAMEGKGKLEVKVERINQWIHIDISDSGKGMTKNQFKKIFKPGFSTKTRGWGLGLTLAHRIIMNYHQGKIIVLQSELGKGTTFRISLPTN